MLIRNRMTITPRPTKIQISTMWEISNISPPLLPIPWWTGADARRSIELVSGLRDQVQIVHNPIWFVMAQENFAVVHGDANSAAAPDVSFAVAHAANAVAAHRAPTICRVLLDLGERYGLQTQAQGANLDAVPREVVMEAVPRHAKNGDKQQRHEAGPESHAGVRHEGDRRNRPNHRDREEQAPALARMHFFRDHFAGRQGRSAFLGK